MVKKVLLGLIVGGCAVSATTSNAMFNASLLEGQPDFLVVSDQYASVCCGACMASVFGVVVLTQRDCLGDCAEKVGQLFGLAPLPVQKPAPAVVMSAVVMSAVVSPAVVSPETAKNK